MSDPIKITGSDGKEIEIADATEAVAQLQKQLADAQATIETQSESIKAIQKAHAQQAANAYVSAMQAESVQLGGIPVGVDRVTKIQKALSGELSAQETADALREAYLEISRLSGGPGRRFVSSEGGESPGTGGGGWSQADREFTAQQLREGGKKNVEVKADGVYVEGRKVTD